MENEMKVVKDIWQDYETGKWVTKKTDLPTDFVKAGSLLKVELLDKDINDVHFIQFVTDDGYFPDFTLFDIINLAKVGAIEAGDERLP